MNDRPEDQLKAHVERSTAAYRDRASGRLSRQRRWLRPRLQLRRHQRGVVLGSMMAVGLAAAAAALMAGPELPSWVQAAGLVIAVGLAYAVVWLER